MELAESLAPGARIVPLWRNELGGITVRLDPLRARSSLVLKYSPPGCEIDLASERARLAWAGAFHRVCSTPAMAMAPAADSGCS